MAYFAAAQGAQTVGALADYVFNKPKKPKPMAGQYMQKLQEQGLQMANQATSNAGLLLGPTAAQRGMSGSGATLNALSNVASNASREAVGGAQKGYLTALLDDRRAQENYDETRRQQLSNVIGQGSQAAGDTLAGYGMLNEQARQQKLIDELLMRIYPKSEYDAYFGGAA